MPIEKMKTSAITNLEIRASYGGKHIRAPVKQESLPPAFELASLTDPVRVSDSTQPGWEWNDGYEFSKTRKSMERPIYELRQIDEMKPKDVRAADRIKKGELRLTVVKALLSWIPNIHRIALQAGEDSETAESAMTAHRCLLFAVNTMHTVESLGECYDVEDLEYHKKVQLLSSQGVVIHSWGSVAGYDPFRIMLWVWRDICLSILSKEDNKDGADSSEERKAEAFISRILDDIRLCIPLDAYDFREKKAKHSLWDLFLNGGFDSNPTYWSLDFVDAMHRLEQLYVSCRLTELQQHPSYDLYTSIKASLPEKYKSQALTVVENIRYTAPTLNGCIDIFTHERCTIALNALIHQRLLRRDTVRFRNIVLPYSHDKSPAVAEWAYVQVVLGFQEAVDAFCAELGALFPRLDAALAQEKDKKVHMLEDFLAAARGDKGTEVAEDTEIAEATSPAADTTTDTAPDRGGEKPAVAVVEWVYTFRGYLTIVREWFWGQTTPNGTRLKAKLRDVFTAKLGFVLLYDRFVGKALKIGCARYDAVELCRCLDYFVGKLGFEVILEAPGGGGEAKKKAVPGARKARRGVAVAKAKGKAGRSRKV